MTVTLWFPSKGAFKKELVLPDGFEMPPRLTECHYLDKIRGIWVFARTGDTEYQFSHIEDFKDNG